jgi:transposase
MRRWVHAVGWGWKRATLIANDDAPHRVERLARIRFVSEPLQRREALVCADARALHVLPTVGDAWMPQGTQVEVLTPGTNAQHDLAGARDLATGTLPHGVGLRTTHGRFRDVRQTLEAVSPTAQYQRISVGVDHDKIHTAKAVEEWFATHPRLRVLLLPTYGPRATPIERAFGDVHALCTRNHTRTRLHALVADVVEHLRVHGPWKYKRSALYDASAVTVAVERMVMDNTLAAAG